MQKFATVQPPKLPFSLKFICVLCCCVYFIKVILLLTANYSNQWDFNYIFNYFVLLVINYSLLMCCCVSMMLNAKLLHHCF